MVNHKTSLTTVKQPSTRDGAPARQSLKDLLCMMILRKLNFLIPNLRVFNGFEFRLSSTHPPHTPHQVHLP